MQKAISIEDQYIYILIYVFIYIPLSGAIKPDQGIYPRVTCTYTSISKGFVSMGTFGRHSCSKFTLRASHWLPSASLDRASRAPEDYNSINTFLSTILSPSLLTPLTAFPSSSPPVGAVTGQRMVIFCNRRNRGRVPSSRKLSMG